MPIEQCILFVWLPTSIACMCVCVHVQPETCESEHNLAKCDIGLPSLVHISRLYLSPYVNN